MKTLYLLLSVICTTFLFSKLSYAQVINTFAGNGVAGYGGDGGSATGASLSRPISCVMDAAGNLYISDFANSRIRKVTAMGTIITIAGTGTSGFSGDGGPAALAQISNPEKITIDVAGNIYFCDFTNQRVREINTAGIISTIAGTGVTGYTGDGGPATAATFWFPAGIAVDAAGNIYISDEWNNRIRMINTAGIISTIAGDGPLGAYSGGYGGDGGPATAAQINFPVGIAVTASGNIIFSDDGNSRIREISPSGIINTIAGDGIAGSTGDGGPATSAEVNGPEGITVDPSGNIYICETSGNRLREINSSGIISTVAGTGIAGFAGDGGAATSAEMDFPEGVFVDTLSSCIYLCDSHNNRVRRVGSCSSTGTPPCLTDTLIINTGYNPLTGAAIAPGVDGGAPVPDPHWTVSYITPDVAAAMAMTPISGLIEVVPGNSADIVTPPVGGSWTTNPATNPGGWISCLNSCQYYDNAADTATWNMLLSRTFRMCVDDSIVFTFNIANDNYISAIKVDGTLLSFSQPALPITSNFERYTYFTQTLFLASGTHTITVTENNYDVTPPAQENPTGLDVYGTVSSATGSNPLVSESSTACLSYVCGAVSPCNTVSLADSLYGCVGSMDTLHGIVSGADSIASIHWSPAAGLSDTGILDPVLTIDSSGWYYLTVASLLPGNLVVNGDFSAGNTGFTSGYSYVSGPGSLVPAGVYAITTDPHLDHSDAASFGDHTTGTGNMMAINGASTPIDVWCETVSVTPYTNYNFSAWFANWSSDTSDNLPIIQYQINGVLVGPSFNFPHADGVWTNFNTPWNSDTNTSVTICLYDEQTAAFGNDFAVDDISFSPVCIAEDSIYVAVAIPDTVHMHTDTSVCSGASGITLSSPAGYTTPEWSNGATTASINVASSGVYWVTQINGCILHEDTFDVVIHLAPVVNLGDDTSFCIGNSLVLSSAQPAGSVYLWSTGGTGDAVTVTGSGSYWLSVTDSGCSAADTIDITVYPIPVVILGPDTAACQGTAITLQPVGTYTGATYEWSTGAVTPEINVTAGGSYWLDVTENDCTGTDTVSVDIRPLPVVVLDTNTVLCPGSTLTIGPAEPAGVSYMWSTGSRDSSISITNSGIYSLTVTDSGCAASAAIVVTELWPPTVNLGPDTTLCTGQVLILQANTEASYYLWTGDSSGLSYMVSQTGAYWVDVSNQCGSATDTINVTFNFCEIWFPSAFTPNGDGKNDIARVRGSLGDFTDFSLSIYNRFGQLVYFTQDIYDGWDGNFNGAKADVGTYFYMVIYSLNGNKQMMKGDVTLIR